MHSAYHIIPSTVGLFYALPIVCEEKESYSKVKVDRPLLLLIDCVGKREMSVLFNQRKNGQFVPDTEALIASFAADFTVKMQRSICGHMTTDKKKIRCCLNQQ